MVLDTGAARNLVRKKFARQLQRESTTRSGVGQRSRGDRTIQLEGIAEGVLTQPVETFIDLSFRPIEVPTNKPERPSPVDPKV